MFWRDEFQCKCCDEHAPEGMNPCLIFMLSILRREIRNPIVITSGYRCPEHNANVGGVPNSRHILGNASDFYSDGYSSQCLINVLGNLMDDYPSIRYYAYAIDDFAVHLQINN